MTFGLPCAILKEARTRESSHRQRRAAAVLIGAKAFKLLTFGQPRAMLKRSSTRESSHRQCRGAAVLIGANEVKTFELLVYHARNLEASPHEGQFAQAKPWRRSGTK